MARVQKEWESKKEGRMREKKKWRNRPVKKDREAESYAAFFFYLYVWDSINI